MKRRSVRRKPHSSWSQTGSLLLETFVAMMVLSVGVSGSLKVFGQALFSQQRIGDLQQARVALDQKLFYWFAYQGDPDQFSEERVVPPFGAANDDLRLQVRSSDLKQQFIEEEEKKSKEKRERGLQFYDVNLRVLTGQKRDIFDLDTIVLRNEPVKSESKAG